MVENWSAKDRENFLNIAISDGPFLWLPFQMCIWRKHPFATQNTFLIGLYLAKLLQTGHVFCFFFFSGGVGEGGESYIKLTKTINRFVLPWGIKMLQEELKLPEGAEGAKPGGG